MSHFTLADDDEKYLFLLHHLLATAFPGYSIASFSNAEDALDYILHSGTKLLITDHTMGRLSGTDLIRQLRQHGSSLPIILISGNPEAETEALSVGANLFLQKDAVLKRLTEEVKRLCEPNLA